MLRLTLSSCALFFFLGITSLSAGVPNTVNYQGRVTDATGAPIADGTILVKFQIYDAATGGTVLWNSNFQSVITVDGVFSYDLGSNVTLPDLFASDTVRYLGITVGTDPEISPRTRFTCSGYVFEAQKSDIADIAMNSDSLGGQHPSYYLDWGNMTSIPAGFADGIDDTTSAIDWTAVKNVPAGFADGVDDTTTAIDWSAVTNMPAGFADGVDDVGIDQATANNSFVNTTGDVMTGGLNLQKSGVNQITLDVNGGGVKILNSVGNQTARLSGFSVGELELWDAQNPPVNTVSMLAWANGGELQINNSSGIDMIHFRGNPTGDIAVMLPTDAVNSDEMLDEPGIVQGRATGGVTLTVNMVDLATVTITTPAPGYIFLQGRTIFRFSGTTGPNTAFLQIDETSGGSVANGIYSRVGMDAYSNTGMHYFDCSTQRTYFKPSGSYTFRLESSKYVFAIGTVDCFYPILTAFFIPTSYGSVSTVAGQPGDNPTAEAVSVTDLDGSTHTAYKMDLRYYEEKARAAKMAKQKAELAEAQAELELTRARNNAEQK